MDVSSATSAVHRPGRGRVFDSIVDAIGDTPIVRLRTAAAAARGERDHSRQAGIFQSRGEREGPHRRGDDRGDGEGRRDPRRHRADRTDVGKYRDRTGIRCRLARLPAEAGDAGIDVDRAAQDAGIPRRRNRSDAGRAGHEGVDRDRRRAGADDAQCGDAAAVQEPRQSRNSSPHHGGGNLERYRRQHRLSSSQASAPAAPSPGWGRC